MRINVRYFASIREALGSGEAIEVIDGSTVAAVREALIGRDAAHAIALAHGSALRCALNQMLCDENAFVNDEDELAFFPPVTGG
jgi:sulfur-carrier protein